MKKRRGSIELTALVIIMLFSTMILNYANELSFRTNQILLNNPHHLDEMILDIQKIGETHIGLGENRSNFVANWKTNGFVGANITNGGLAYAFKINPAATKPYIFPMLPGDQIRLYAALCPDGTTVSFGAEVQNTRMSVHNYANFDFPCP